MVAAESGTCALIGAAFGPLAFGEQTVTRDLVTAFGPGMLVLAEPGTRGAPTLVKRSRLLWTP